MPIAPKLIQIALAEWERWGFSTVSAHGRSAIGGTQPQIPFVNFVNDYWHVVGRPTWNGHTRQPWSAAFVSFCFKEGGAGRAFPYHAAAAGYCGAIVRRPAAFPDLAFADPATTAPGVGDVIISGRAEDRCGRPPATHALALEALRRPEGGFGAHGDIVVAVRAGEVDVIGGDVADSVAMTTFATADGLLADARHLWLGIVRPTM